MKKNNPKKAMQAYGNIGKSLCGVAGAIVGFLVGGPFLAIPGILVGVVGSTFLEKCVVNPAL